MTAKDPTPEDRENVAEESDINRLPISAEGLAHAEGEYFGGDFGEGPVKIQMYQDENPGAVAFTSVYGEGPPETEILVNLTPEQARQFAQTLIERAAGAEDRRATE